MPQPSRISCTDRCEVWRVGIPRPRDQSPLTRALLEQVRAGWGHWSISHTRGLGLVAVADRPVGVDVEALRPRPRLARVVARVAAEAEGVCDERELYALWCGREAWAKAHGAPLGSLREVAVRAQPLDVGPGYVAALVLA
jgi:phosphopantetheinyl transferase